MVDLYYDTHEQQDMCTACRFETAEKETISTGETPMGETR